ncbi:MAG: SHOCT domain-containing protein [Anaerolineae bacterium]|jgi:putative membrane protein
MMGFGFLGMLLFWGFSIAIVIGGALLVIWLAKATRPSMSQRLSTARQTLDERFAKGEIDQEEYEAIRSQIER